MGLGPPLTGRPCHPREGEEDWRDWTVVLILILALKPKIFTYFDSVLNRHDICQIFYTDNCLHFLKNKSEKTEIILPKLHQNYLYREEFYPTAK